MAFHRTYEGLLQRLEALLPRRARPRQTRLYCVGAPRTGTHSIAALFDRTIRSRHEPAFRAATKQVLAHHRGLVSFDELRRFVRRRDGRLGLEVDSSHVNAFLIEALLAEFVDARFVLTIRDCFSWTDSAMNHTRNSRQWSAADRQYVEFYFGSPHAGYTAHDAVLQQRGLLSLDCYLAAWRRHNDTVLASVPPERLLVVRTNEIAEQRHRIAEFAGIAADHLAAGFRAQGVAKARHGVLDGIDAAYLEDRCAAQCGALMRRFFPDVRSLQDARALESRARLSRSPAT